MEPVPGDGSSSGVMGKAWGSGSDQDFNFKLSWISIALSVLILSWRAYHYFKHRNDPPPPPPPEPETPQPKPRRTQDFIEQMLILKNVLWVKPERKDTDLTVDYGGCGSTGRGDSSGSDSASEDDQQHQEQQQQQQQQQHELDSIFAMQRAKSNLILQEGDHEDSGLDLCAICLCPYESGDQICWSNNQSCVHHFHAACGIAWLAKHEECPICRAEYLVEPEAAAESKDNAAGEDANDDDIEEGGSAAEQEATDAAPTTTSSTLLTSSSSNATPQDTEREEVVTEETTGRSPEAGAEDNV